MVTRWVFFGRRLRHEKQSGGSRETKRTELGRGEVVDDFFDGTDSSVPEEKREVSSFLQVRRSTETGNCCHGIHFEVSSDEELATHFGGGLDERVSGESEVDGYVELLGVRQESEGFLSPGMIKDKRC